MALRCFVEELEDVGPLKPILAQLMDSIFKLMNEVRAPSRRHSTAAASLAARAARLTSSHPRQLRAACVAHATRCMFGCMSVCLAELDALLDALCVASRTRGAAQPLRAPGCCLCVVPRPRCMHARSHPTHRIRASPGRNAAPPAAATTTAALSAG